MEKEHRSESEAQRRRQEKKLKSELSESRYSDYYNHHLRRCFFFLEKNSIADFMSLPKVSLRARSLESMMKEEKTTSLLRD